MDSVSVRYRWTLSEMQEATRWHFRQVFRLWVFPYILIVLWLLGAGFVAYVSLRSSGTGHAWPGASASIYLVLLVGLILWLPGWRLKRNFSKNANRDMEISWQITQMDLRVEHPNGSADMKWSLFNKAILTPTGLLLYSQPALFHWLPRAGFDSEEGYEAVTVWARQHIKAFRTLRSKDDKNSSLS